MNFRFAFLLLSVPALWAQGAQSLRPRIGVIDFFGVQKVPVEKLRKALGVKEGDPLPSSKGEVEAQLMDVPGVVGATLEAACCEEGKAILYVGIEERGSVHFSDHAEPDGTATLPEEVTKTYREFLLEVANAARAGLTAEDLTQGHSLMQDATVRAIQMKFVGYASTYAKELHDVIRDSSDEEARAIAAYVIGYAPDKKAVLDDLFYAMRDPDDVVRANAIRALSAITVKAKLDPDAEIKIPATWFIEMLNSTVWTDRNYAATALVTLTESRDEKVLAQLKERALPSLVEMARWKHPEHAIPGYILLGRVSGISEQELQEAWKEGKREEIIARATAPVKKKR